MTAVRSHLTTRRLAGLVGVVAAVTALPALAADPAFDGPTTANRTAVRMPQDLDLVSVYNTGELRPAVESAANAAAFDAGGIAVAGRSISVGMRSVRRGNAAVQQAAPGWQYPMGLTILPQEAVGWIMDPTVAGQLALDRIVMGRTSADLRGARAGDVVELVAANGASVNFTIGLVVDDAAVGGTELVMSYVQADRLGATRKTRMVIFGFRSREAIDAALAARGLSTSTSIRVRRGWDLFDPDDTLGLARTKASLGEFSYTLSGSGSMSVSTDWSSAYIPPGRETYQSIPIRAQCNYRIKSDLQAALNEVAAAGLGGAIDVGNANTYGGCYYPRFNRISANLGFLSRHSWGMALDTNTVSNCQGCIPRMDCRVVRIFRKHNFAWGGNFLTPDGMHFEWVGDRRDLYPYPSRFCPNVVNPATQRMVAETQRATMFAADGFELGDDHGH